MSTDLNQQPRYWAVIPAAGAGMRVGADRPKQYLAIGSKPVIEHTLATLLAIPYLAKIVVVLDQNDSYWPSTQYANHPHIITAEGGKERVDSVHRGVKRLLSLGCAAHDWILVHDAARPCLRAADIQKLVNALQGHPVGGLLGYRTRDTMKMVNAQQQVAQTIARQQVWHALTPQMFRAQLLLEALVAAVNNTVPITDEASAIELSGYQPMMVEGRSDNIKITTAEDLQLAEFYLGRVR